MTDEALSAPADAVAAPETIVEAPKVETTATPEAPKFEATPRGAVERAMAKLNEQEKPKAEATGDRARDPATGQFAPKEGQPQTPPKPAVPEPKAQTAQPTLLSEPPSRFSADAKAQWATLPDAVKGEIHRTHRELESGLERYRESATAYDEVREFAELARNSGTTMKAAMSNYVGIEMKLREDPIGGLSQIAENLGFSLKDIAAQVMGQAPDQAASQQDQVIRALKQEIAGLKEQVGGVTTTIQEQNKAGILKQIEAFASDPAHSRFDELSAEIERQIQGGFDLSEAYRRAEMLNPLPPAPVIAGPQTPAQEPAPQTRKGSLTITGAPGNGSDPSASAPSSSIRESIRNARAAVG